MGNGQIGACMSTHRAISIRSARCVPEHRQEAAPCPSACGGAGRASLASSLEAVEPGHLLRLRAEMKVLGRAWLQFEATPGLDTTLLVQMALFTSKGVWRLLYWYEL